MMLIIQDKNVDPSAAQLGAISDGRGPAVRRPDVRPVGRIRSRRPSPIVPSVPYTTTVTESRFLVIRRGKCSDERDTPSRVPSYPVRDDSEYKEGSPSVGRGRGRMCRPPAGGQKEPR